MTGAGRPQPVLAELTPAAIYLVLTVDPGGERAVRQLLAGLDKLTAQVAALHPEGGLTAVAGIGSQAYDRVIGGARPAELHPFEPIVGARHTAVS
ncbi:MAG: Dyp-type peroxidase, partial [Actinomycetia bacterium]|nr:Dyp-type peroxidase [Actinomycetes bacterium]